MFKKRGEKYINHQLFLKKLRTENYSSISARLTDKFGS